MTRRERLSNCLTAYKRQCCLWKQCLHGVITRLRCNGGEYLISGRYFSNHTASYMKSETNLFSFTLFLTAGAIAKTFYINGFWEHYEQNLSERVEIGAKLGRGRGAGRKPMTKFASREL